MTGRVHSIQTLGTVDGPGVRFVVFLQGCPLRCGCCHNPDARDFTAGEEYSAAALMEKVRRYRDYFGRQGGITLSGGEPLCQAAFAYELFSLCRKEGVHTCLDTSGCLWNEDVARLLSVTDYAMLDVKYTREQDYLDHVGCPLSTVLRFLGELDQRKIPTRLRQVVIPGKNDGEENILALRAVKEKHGCVREIELLPFRTLCLEKYEQMGIPFPFAHIPEPTPEHMAALRARLENEK